MNTSTPNPPTQSRLHPLVAIAAISVTAFSLFGIAAINGWLPSGKATSDEKTAVTAVAAPASEAKPQSPSEVTKAASAPSKETNAVDSNSPKPVAKTTSKPVQKPAAAKPAPVEIAQAPTAQTPATPAPVAQAPVAPVAAPPVPPVCSHCGVIQDIREITQPGEATGLGAVAGGVIGGLLGSQIGGGTGKKLATVAGVAGGAYAGHQIEKSQRKTTRYEVIVRMNDGSLRTVMMDSVVGWQVGERVRVENGLLVRD